MQEQMPKMPKQPERTGQDALRSAEAMSESDFAQDNPEAVARGKELIDRYEELLGADKLEEALKTLTEDRFACAAYLAAQYEAKHPTGMKMAIRHQLKDTFKRTGLDLVAELETKLRNAIPEATKKERQVFFDENKGNLEAALAFYRRRVSGRSKPTPDEWLECCFDVQGGSRKAPYPDADRYRHRYTMRHVANLFEVDEYALRKAEKTQVSEKK